MSLSAEKIHIYSDSRILACCVREGQAIHSLLRHTNLSLHSLSRPCELCIGKVVGDRRLVSTDITYGIPTRLSYNLQSSDLRLRLADLTDDHKYCRGEIIGDVLLARNVFFGCWVVECGCAGYCARGDEDQIILGMITSFGQSIVSLVYKCGQQPQSSRFLISPRINKTDISIVLVLLALIEKLGNTGLSSQSHIRQG